MAGSVFAIVVAAAAIVLGVIDLSSPPPATTPVTRVEDARLRDATPVTDAALQEPPVLLDAAVPDDALVTAIRIHITTTPAGATIILDGQRLGHSPFDGSVPKSLGAHTLKIRRRGYATVTIAVELAGDLIQDLTLEADR